MFTGHRSALSEYLFSVCTFLGSNSCETPYILLWTNGAGREMGEERVVVLRQISSK